MIEFVVLSIPTLIYLLVTRRRPDGRAVMGLLPGRPADYAWALLAAVALGALSWAALLAVPDELLHGPGTTGRITGALTLAGVILRAVGEEVFFRGFLQGLLRRRLAFWPANLAQGVLFLLPHLLLLLVDARMWPILPVQFLAGLTMGWLRERSGSIGPPSLVHALLNVVAGLA